jgi:feruloyl esterase
MPELNRKMKPGFLLMAFMIVTVGSVPVFAATCESLATLKLPQTTITSAQEVGAGAFVPPGGAPDPGGMFNPKNLPAFCRVQATLKPAPDSDIKIEVWLPLTGWNGRFRGQGNGGFAGYVDYTSLGIAISSGFAAAGTNTGHDGSPIDASWAKGHPDKIVDFGWRAIHEMTLKAKAIVQAFYGEAPKHSYFTGCSNGGRQALMEAQRFPEDYDGIIAGAPANYWTKVFATFIFDIQAMQSTTGSYIGPDKIPVIAKAVAAACDANDGVKDGVLNDPRACRFNPEILLCKQGDSADCLSAPQVAALKKIYAGPHDASGKLMYPGFEPGGEDGPGGWVTWIGQGPGKDLQTLFANGFFGNMITSKEPVDLKTINVEVAVKLADEQQGKTFNADDPNLKAFAARGGRLIMYHGWSDAALPPRGAINYFESVQAALGRQQTDAFMRLYMAPGVQHCGGGPGANAFGQSALRSDPQHDIHEALEQWVEKDTAPERIIATKFVNPADHSKGAAMTRPLCPYPQFAKYKGTGDTSDAANFECAQRVVRASAEDVGAPASDAAGPYYNLKTSGVTAPRALQTHEPKYSSTARANRVEGIVKLSVIIGADGRIHDVKVLEPLEPTLDANAIEAVKTWKFTPATKDGKPVAVMMQLEVDYRLR